MLPISSRIKSTAKGSGRKPVRVDSAAYGRLLARVLPSVIDSETENGRLLGIVEEMMSRELSPEEGKLFDLLVKLIEDFEHRRYSPAERDPVETLRFLMEQHSLRQKDLVHLFGSRGITSEVVNGKRGISKAQARALADFFKVPADLFL